MFSEDLALLEVVTFQSSDFQHGSAAISHLVSGWVYAMLLDCAFLSGFLFSIFAWTPAQMCHTAL